MGNVRIKVVMQLGTSIESSWWASRGMEGKRKRERWREEGGGGEKPAIKLAEPHPCRPSSSIWLFTFPELYAQRLIL